MRLSIVSTLYRSADYIEALCDGLCKCAAEITQDFEIILVNDGSPDNSLEVALRVAQNIPQVVVVDLSRNFGHHRAMMAGLEHSVGDLVFLIDSDLEEDPQWLTSFYRVISRVPRCDVVYGVQKDRKGGLVEVVSGHLFYLLINSLSDIKIPKNVVTARLMRRNYVEALLRYQESEIYIGDLFVNVGFNQVPLEVSKTTASKSTYTLRKRMAAFTNAITSMTDRPLAIIFYCGLLISTTSGLATVILLIWTLLYGSPTSGWASVILSTWLLGGVSISFTGIVAVYLSKVFKETKHRPPYIVRETYRSKSGGGES